MKKVTTLKHKTVKDDIKIVCSKLDKVLPAESAKFVKSQIQIHQRKSSRGNKWMPKDKMFALSVFYHSRKVYRLLCRLCPMPSKTTLLSLLGRSKIYPGFHDNILEALKNKVSKFGEKDKQCVLVFDEMAVKSDLSYNKYCDQIEGFEDFGSAGQSKFVANHALAFMVRGLAQKWKQCFGYFLSSGPISGSTLQDLTKQAIDKLAAIGLSVRVLICDQGSNNRRFVQTLSGVTVDKPYFVHDDRKVYVMYDPPHLLKNIRNNLHKHGFLYNDDPIKWKYVVQFYDFDKEGGIKMAPKLTDNHINLPMFTKMRVNLAAQVLSHSVAAGMSTMQRLGRLPEEAKVTANFLEQMDQLFNCFNSSSVHSKRKFGHALSANSGHIQFLHESRNYLNNLELPHHKPLPCLEGWKMAISSLLALWEDLSENFGFKFLLTNRLNQDCAENLFSIIRGKGGKRDNPDAREFRAAYRQVVFDQMLLPSKGSNCKEDEDNVLLSLTSMDMAHTSPAMPSTSSSNEQPLPDKLPGVDMLLVIKPPANVPIQNIEAYMAGYLLRKAKVSDCQTCKEQLVYDVPPNTEIYIFLKEKAYKETNTLVYPTETFIQLVENWESSFSTVLDAVKHLPGVLRRLCKNAEDVCVDFLNCTDDKCNVKLSAMLTLYMKVRIHSAIKNSNKDNKKPGMKRNRKLLKLQHV
jgi:hypothetical protein